MKLRPMRRSAATAAALLLAILTTAHAEVGEVRISKQYGLPYLPMMVIEEQKLIEKHAKVAGLGDITLAWTTQVGPAAQLDALLAGQVDFISPGATTLATIWDKTVGTPQEVRALIAMQSMPFVLVTRNPAVKTIADFTAKDKIALPAVKLTGHALILEMAAAKLWGDSQYDKLDELTITRSHPDAAAAVMGGGSEITSHFASSPYYYYELARPEIHQVLKSYDVTGGKHTNGVLIAQTRFHDANPKICAAVVAAFNEANAFINASPRKAAGIYLAKTREKATLDELEKMVADPDVAYTTTPAKVMQFVLFMHKVGRIKKKPNSWKDLFFPEAHGMDGS